MEDGFRHKEEAVDEGEQGYKESVDDRDPHGEGKAHADRREFSEGLRKFVQRAAILIFDGDLRAKPKAKNAGPEQYLNLAPEDTTTERLSLSECAGRNDTLLWDVDALSRGGFKILQQRADTVQRGEAIAADGPVVCEGREADDPGSGTELVEERVDDE